MPAGAMGSVGGHDIVIVADIKHKTKAQLLEVIQTIDLLRLLLRSGQCRQQHGGQNGDDGDDHQQFDQRETRCLLAGLVIF